MLAGTSEANTYAVSVLEVFSRFHVFFWGVLPVLRLAMEGGIPVGPRPPQPHRQEPAQDEEQPEQAHTLITMDADYDDY